MKRKKTSLYKHILFCTFCKWLLTVDYIFGNYLLLFSDWLERCLVLTDQLIVPLGTPPPPPPLHPSTHQKCDINALFYFDCYSIILSFTFINIPLSFSYIFCTYLLIKVILDGHTWKVEGEEYGARQKNEKATLFNNREIGTWISWAEVNVKIFLRILSFRIKSNLSHPNIYLSPLFGLATLDLISVLFQLNWGEEAEEDKITHTLCAIECLCFDIFRLLY